MQNEDKKDTNNQPRSAWLSDIFDELKIPKGHQTVMGDFMTANWIELSAYAYGGFMKSGRGLLFIAASGSLTEPKIEYIYFGWQRNQQSLKSGCNESFFDRLQNYVSSYEPEEEIVMVFEFNGQIAQELEQETQSDANSFDFWLKPCSVTFDGGAGESRSVPLPSPKKAYQTLASAAIAQAIKEFN